ncbi:hypothetical protein, partial [Roseateles sp. P5_E11]
MDVKKENVRSCAPHLGNGRLTRVAFNDGCHIWIGTQQDHKVTPGDRLVVDHQDPQRRHSGHLQGKRDDDFDAILA